jgi:hypothetical protein
MRINNALKKAASSIGFKLPDIKISPEREQELIEKIVNATKKSGMEDFVILWGSQMIPISRVFSMTVMMPFAPFLQVAGLKGWEYVAFLENEKNIQTIITRLADA